MKRPVTPRPPPEPRAEIDRQLQVIRRGHKDLVTEPELRRKLERSLREGKPLRVKLGIDPSTPDLHLGHVIPLFKLKDFQDLGHEAVLIVGDGTARIGDPTGRNKTRPQLSKEEVDRNAETYLRQARKVLGSGKLEVVRNGVWFSRMDFFDTVKLASRMTAARMLERDYFAERWKAGTEIRLHELVYPLMQGWDSVMVRSDVELGGTDQLFNLLVGRDLQEQEGQEPQVCLTTPLLPGTDGRKMSKSYANAIEVRLEANEMYGKLMSIPDDQMRQYYECLTRIAEAEIGRLLKGHPREAKVHLAREIVGLYSGKAEAEKAAREFDRIHRDREMPMDLPELRVASPSSSLEFVVASGFASSRSAGRRLIEQGGVRFGDRRVSSAEERISVPPEGLVLQVGKKKFVRLLPAREA